MTLPTAIYTVSQVRALDQFAIEDCHIAGYTLMTRAAAAALAVLQRQWPHARRIVVLCGAGNNGGDGYVLARLAHEVGIDATAIALAPRERLKGDALKAHDAALAASVAIKPFNVYELVGTDLIVDAIFGTGLDREVDAVTAAIIERANHSGLPILALDVPSGLHSDTGHLMGSAIRADHTVSFVGLKAGCFVGQGTAVTGELHFAGLAIPEPKGQALDLSPVLERLDRSLLDSLLPPRPRDAHKGMFGHVLVVGGGIGMPGALRLCSEACLRSGAGLVSIATLGRNVATVIGNRPEVMGHPIDDPRALETVFEKVDVVVIGPGLGRDAWAREVFERTLATDLPLIVDADALNLLAQGPRRRDNWILTPHPGEAGRLLASDAATVQRDRLAAASALADTFGGVSVLKGAGTLISQLGTVPSVCTYGNPGMATAGMGDVLAGVTGALLAQLRDPWLAARAAVLAHALAGDTAGKAGERGLIASDLFEPLRACLNPRRR